MKKLNVIAIALFTLFLAAFTACKSPQKSFENGNYDQAVDQAIERLRKTKVKERDVATLVEAFNYINQRETEKLGRLRLENNPDNWDDIYAIATSINRRQEMVRPLVALDEEKYYGQLQNLHFTEGVVATIAEAREGAAAHLYNRANQKLDLAKSGNRRLAREAYDDFKAIDKYYTTYKDVKALSSEAYALGINHVYVKVENDTRTYLPSGFERELESIFVRDLNEKWVKYHTFKDENLRYDYTIVARMTDINVSRDRERRDHHIEEAQVEDGFDYVLDSRGNVKKDSLGNDVKVKKFRWVRADVFEITQTKEAIVSGYVEYFDNRTKERLLSRPIQSNAIFNNTAVTFEGDRRALRHETACRLGGHPVPFPTDEALLMTVAENMKNRAKDMIRNNDHIVAR
ncbi:MAG: hypothetical protein JNL70_03055 [Saprospiraceae bacterium]|nr:hypothetical protein [Saprospiraceae bacterium]